jgi:aspartyl-tRNA(Asn)/glutamyl-tRNA(Gln) amidotransferase subunit B
LPRPVVSIGLEVHAQLLTRSKMFCACECGHGGRPNTRVCPVCLGLPGALPYLNARAVELGVAIGIALGCRIRRVSAFARKNYFYPDLPKGYQISQYEEPLCEGGEITIDARGGTRRVRLRRVHLEEDAGKSLHEPGGDRGSTAVDMNRCGVPLIEIVSEPEIRSPAEAVACLRALRLLMRYLDVCDGDMERGSLRCDVNVSLAAGEEGSGANTEIKNLNSFRAVERSLRFEISRQSAILEAGGSVTRETMLWDETRRECVPMRAKEEAQDYRYFPEPDLTPLVVSADLVERIGRSLPEPPRERTGRLERQYALRPSEARTLTSRRSLADFFEECVGEGAAPRAAANWAVTELLRAVKERKSSPAELRVTPRSLAALLGLIAGNVISGSAAKAVFGEMLETGEEPEAAVARLGLAQVSDEGEVLELVAGVLEDERRAVAAYLKGKSGALEYMVGAAIRRSGGVASPGLVRAALVEALDRMSEDGG